MAVTKGTTTGMVKKVDPQSQAGGYGFRPTQKPPAWLGNSAMGGVQSGPSWDDPTQLRLQQVQSGGTSAATSEQVSTRDDIATPRPVFALGGNIVRDRAHDGVTSLRDIVPAWLPPMFSRPPAYGGDYSNVIKFAEDVAPVPTINPKVGFDPLQVYPNSQTHPYPITYANPAQDVVGGGGGGGGGFGTRYKRFGGSSYGGYSDYQAPAWFNPDMGLFQWNYKG